MSIAEGAPAGRRSFLRRRAAWISAFWRRAYEENITGLAAMVAYNLALALFPFALLLLFIFGQVLSNPDVQAAILNDLQGIFPAVEQDELARTLTRIQANSTTIGVLAAAGAIWIGTSFWGAMDTAFCRIYHVECRSWLAQKRFALLMLVVVALFLAASVVIPILEGLLLRSSSDLPFGLDSISWLDNLLFLLATLLIVFVTCTQIYFLVPKGRVPWNAIWPGALFVTVVMGLANAIFPVYLSEVSAIDRVGGALGFILIALLWFYLISLALMAGAVINALRYELKDTGTVRIPGWQPS